MVLVKSSAFPALLCLAALAAAPASAEEAVASAEPGAESAPPAPPKTVAAEQGPFRVALDLAGRFEAGDAVDVAFEPEVYGGELEIVESLPAGPVEAGTPLVRFDTERIDDQVRLAELDFEIARIQHERQLADAERQSQANALSLARAERAAAEAAAALEQFRTVELPLRLEEADYRLQVSRDNLADQQEELDQLEKMYTADELTEETEEIVLQRQRRQLERLRRILSFQETRDRMLREVELPRDLKNHEYEARKQELDLARTRLNTEAAEAQARHELEKARIAFARQEQQLAKLRADREAMVVRAPVAGYAVPGSIAKGKWSGVDAATVEPGTRVKARQTLYTIVRPGPQALRVLVPEASLLEVRPGAEVTVSPTALRDETIAGRVVTVSRVAAGDDYEALVALERSDERIMPGYGAKVKIVVHEQPQAITLPVSAVAGKGAERHVTVCRNGATERRAVTVGRADGGRVEILSGLAAGETVLEKADAK